MRKKRFYYHFNKQAGNMTVHFGGKCLAVNNVWCKVPCNSKWNKQQPYLVMQGWATEVFIDTNNQAVIR